MKKKTKPDPEDLTKTEHNTRKEEAPTRKQLRINGDYYLVYTAQRFIEQKQRLKQAIVEFQLLE